MVEIDSEICTNCGICIDVCPYSAFGIRSTNEHKAVFVRYPESCVACGHCMAFCKPRGIIHPELSYDEYEELSVVDISPAAMKDLLFSRRSVRSYKEETVPDNLIEELIEVAIHAGTGSNTQSVGFLVINDRALLKKLELTVIDILFKVYRPLEIEALLPVVRKIYGDEVTDLGLFYNKYFKRRKEDNELEGAILHNAPTLILAHDNKNDPLGSINCAIAMRNIEVLALTMGLGTCWNGFLISVAMRKSRRINRLLGLDNSRRIWGALTVGYPRHKTNVKIPRKEREVRHL